MQLVFNKILTCTKYLTFECKDLLIGTDHKPLLGILNDKRLENIDNPRNSRIKVKTLAWHFKVVHIQGRLGGG
jgi:hypothetical protein